MSVLHRHYGLIGHPLTHSFSKAYFEAKFKEHHLQDHVYSNFDIQSLDSLRDLVVQNRLSGFNVTIPYKEKIIPLLDRMDTVAQEIGAVNCVRVEYAPDGNITTCGFNTDHYGFGQSIKPFLEPVHERALILGTGGSSRAVAYALRKVGVEVYFVSRQRLTDRPGFLYSELNEYILQSFKLIVNTTPLGMYPNIEACPEIPYEYIGNRHLCYDLVYNPQETCFLKKGKEKGATVVSGVDMLRLQADKSWEIWNTL